MSTRTIVATIIVLALLAGCGGDGGFEPPPNPSPVDTTLDWDEDNWDEEDWQ